MADVSKSDVNDLVIDTDKLYIGVVVDLHNGEFNTVSLPKNVQFYPQANEHGFILHKQKINTPEEIGQKIVDLRGMHDHFFHPRHYNSLGVASWYHRGSIPFSYPIFNYLRKLWDSGLLEGKKTLRAVEKFMKRVNVHNSEEKIKARISEFKLGSSGGNLTCDLCYPGSNYYGPFVPQFLTGLLITTDLNVFGNRNFNIEASERIIYIRNDAKKLVAVVCKILKSDDDNSIGYIVGDQCGYLVTKDHDVLFVNYNEYYGLVCGEEELEYEDYLGPVRKPV